MIEQRNSVPFWLIGVIVALVLILIGQRIGAGSANPVLIEKFAPKPTDPNAPQPQFELPQVSLPNLPPQLQRAVTDLRNRFAGGEAVPALTPVANSVRVKIEVSTLQRNGENVQIRGTLSNIANQPIEVPSSAFSFRDSSGVVYTLGNSGGATIQPGESTPFDLAVPLPADRGLSLIFTLPPDAPIQQTLIVATTS